jgi:hypothetical protein
MVAHVGQARNQRGAMRHQPLELDSVSHRVLDRVLKHLLDVVVL